MRNLFLLRGAPGAGKSTWVSENNLDGWTLSTDNIRLMCESPETKIDGSKCISQKNDGFVWDLLFTLLEKRMENGEFIIIDATHYKAPLINQYNDLVDKYRYRVNVVDFSNISLEELLKRNKERGYKSVPESTIRKMVVALEDKSEIKSAYKIISPDDALAMINDPLKPVEVDKKKVVVFGDIHGCYKPLKEYFDKNPFSEDICYIFCGDYLDRGIQNKEVLDFLISIYKYKNVILLEGNHERWLRIYASKDYNITDYLSNKSYNYKDIFATKIISEFNYKLHRLKTEFRTLENEIAIINKTYEKEKSDGNDSGKIYYEFELVDANELLSAKNNKKKEIENIIARAINIITKLKDEEKNSSAIVDTAINEYKDIFGEELYLDVRKVISSEYNMSINNSKNPIRSEEFMDFTYPQIKDVDLSELRQFCRKFAQLSYFKFNNKLYLVTHAGVPIMPSITMATDEMYRGVGKYEDSRECDLSFIKHIKEDGVEVISIHGHRNVFKDEAKLNGGLTYNLEGQVELGNELRILEIDNNGENVVCIKNDVFDKRFLVKEEEKPVYTDIELLKMMIKSPLIKVKTLHDDVMSLNFTREAFYDSQWNELTCKARGLFVNKKTGEVVARSFTKFFNHNEVEETKDEYLQRNFAYPVVAYKKENGFLGIISKHKGKVHIFTKSSDEGDFVEWFKAILCRKYGLANEDELKKYLSDKLEDEYSYIFECIDPVNDPHIIKYDKEDVYLLEVMKNQMNEEHIPYEALCEVGKKLNVKVKEKSFVFNNWEEFYNFKTELKKEDFNIRDEGYVIEDANGMRVKLKSYFYVFWKQMRTVKEMIQKGAGNKKVYINKVEIEMVKMIEKIDREKLKTMSIIDIENMMGY